MLQVPEILFQLEDEIDEKMRLEPVLKTGKNLVGDINARGRSSLR